MMAEHVDWSPPGLKTVFEVHDAGPIRLTKLHRPGAANTVAAHPIAEVYVAGEGHHRSALGYVGSEVGARLRYTGHVADDGELSLRQRDPSTQLAVTTRIRSTGTGAIQLTQTLRNGGSTPLTLLAAPTIAIKTAAPAISGRLRLVEGRSEWLGEGCWQERPLQAILRDLALNVQQQDARGRYAVISTGAWSTGTVLPTGILVDEAGDAIAWQVEVTAGWLWELAQWRDGVVLTVSGPTDSEHQFAVTLVPGDEFVTAPVALALGEDRDGSVAALTRHRRRIHETRPVDARLPVVYNDYMNTLMGQPSTEALLPLIDRAAAAGAEYFCIDAGWFSDSGEYWGEIGEWREAPTRFTGGLAAVMDTIRGAGMVPGLWLEPEIVGLDSPHLDAIPDEAYFQRHGQLLVEQRRRHLDLRHPAARAHLDQTLDRIVAEFGVGFIKLDYNIDPGVGTDRTGTAGLGLLEHGRALRDWLRHAQRRHPEVLFENCASGAMRMDYALLSVTHLQSTSDQQTAARSAAIAAAAPLSVLPEQAGNWAYPAADMSRGELTLAMVNGIIGRLYLSGFLDRLDAGQFALVEEAVAVHKSLRHRLARSDPFWPIGLPQWDDSVLALGLRAADGTRVIALWGRGAATELTIPGARRMRQVFPARPLWEKSETGGDGIVRVPGGPDAALFEYHGD